MNRPMKKHLVPPHPPASATPPATTGATPWEKILDEYETRIIDMRVALRTDSTLDVLPFSPPENPGPFPSSLTKRAFRLLEEAGAVETDTRYHMRSIIGKLHKQRHKQVHYAQTADASDPSFLDALS